MFSDEYASPDFLLILNEFVDRLYHILELIYTKVLSSFFTKFSCALLAFPFALICKKNPGKYPNTVYEEVVMTLISCLKKVQKDFLLLVHRRQYVLLCSHDFSVPQYGEVKETLYLVKLSCSFYKVFLSLLLNDIIVLSKESKILFFNVSASFWSWPILPDLLAIRSLFLISKDHLSHNILLIWICHRLVYWVHLYLHITPSRLTLTSLAIISIIIKYVFKI